jgi:hypothetical protein
MSLTPANWGQVIGDYLFYPSIIIGNYWQLFAIIALTFAIIVPGSKRYLLQIFKILLLQLLHIAINYLHYCS